MVGIISGNSLGLSSGSLATLGQKGLIGQAESGRNGERVYVNVANGNLVVQGLDESLVNHQLPIELLRTYNSQGQLGDAGHGLGFSGIQRQRIDVVGTLGQADSKLIRIDRDGATSTYTWQADGRNVYQSTDGGGTYDVIALSGKELVWIDGETQQQERYDTPSGRLTRITNPEQHQIDLVYDDRGRLSSLVGTASRIDYQYAADQLVQIRSTGESGQSEIRTRYAYDDQGRLSTVTVDLSPEDSSVADGRVYQTFYTYDGRSDRIASIEQTDGSLLRITYVQVGQDFRVASITNALEQTTTWAYDTTQRSTRVTDALGQSTLYTYDLLGQLESIAAPGKQGQSAVTRFVYNDRGDLIQSIDPMGKTMSMSYDEFGNLTLQRDAAGNTLRRTYATGTEFVKHRLLTESRDLIQDINHPEQLPQALTTRYVYDAKRQERLRFVISPEGRVTEHRYEGLFGNRTRTLSYLSGTYPLETLGSHEAPTEQQLIDWAAQQDQSALQRSDFTYDAAGNLQSEARYEQTDETGEWVEGQRQVLFYVRDAHGRILQTLTSTGQRTHFTYDGMGRLTGRIDALGQSTSTMYDDAGGRVTTTSALALLTTQVFDRAGRLIQELETSAAGQVLGVTRHAYDAAGQRIMTSEPNGVRSWQFHDATGRLAATVDALGAMTEYRYNAAGQIIQQIVHGTRVADTASWVDPQGNPTPPSLVQARPVSAPTDRTTWFVHDQADRLAYQVDAYGGVTRYSYDRASRLIETRAFANRLDPAPNFDSEDLTSRLNSIVPRSEDRVEQRYYDKDGLLIAQVDAEGYLTRMRYDGAGRLFSTQRHANRLSGFDASKAPAHAAPMGDLSQADHLSLRLYDGTGQLSAEINPEGYLTSYRYDANGRLVEKTEYANRVSDRLGAAALQSLPSHTSPAEVRPWSSAHDRITQYGYDALNRVSWESRSPSGLYTTHRYDKDGNLLESQTTSQGEQKTGLLRRYDLQGHVIAELTEVGAALHYRASTDEQKAAIWQQHSIQHRYDPNGQRTSSTDANGYTTLYFYNERAQLTHTVNPLGEVEETQYDHLGQVTARVRYGNRIGLGGLGGGQVTPQLKASVAAIQNALADSTERYSYGLGGELLSSTDALGYRVNRGYDRFGQLTQISRATATAGLQSAESYSYDQRGLLTGTVRSDNLSQISTRSTVTRDAFGRIQFEYDGKGSARQHSYDRLGREVSLYNAERQGTHTSYDAFGRTLSQTDALGNTTHYQYDDQLNRLAVISPEGVVVWTQFTEMGQIQSVTDGKGQTRSFRYDAAGRLITSQDSAGSSSQQFDRAGRLIQTTDARGVITQISYDAANRVLSRTVDVGGLNLLTRYQYDAKGQQLQVTDPNGHVTAFTYDLKGQLLQQVQDPAGLALTQRFSYDPQGHRISTTDAGGTVTQYLFDTLGRRIEERVDPGGLNLTRRYSFDANDNLVKSVDENGHATFYAYDTENRLTYQVNGAGQVQQNTYDAAGRLTRTVQYAQTVNTSNFDDIFSAGPSAPGIAGRIESQLRAPSAQDAIEHRVYDQDNHVTATISGLGAVTRYWHDANGNIIERRSYAAALQMGDPARWVGGLPQAASDDQRDQRVLTSYDAQNRAVFQADATGAVTRMRYDSNGNLIETRAYANRLTAPQTGQDLSARASSLAETAGDIVTRRQYDAANRLTVLIDGVGAVTRFAYDANGNVIQQIRHANILGIGQQLQQLVNHVNDQSTLHTYDRANRRIQTIDALGTVTRFSHDAQGHITRRAEYAPPAGAAIPLPKPPVIVGGGDSVFVVGPTPAPQPQAPATPLPNLDASTWESRITQYSYDAAGRLVHEVNAGGQVTQTLYQGSQRVTIRYAQSINLATLSADAPPQSIQSLIQANTAADRRETVLLDAEQRAVLTINAAGFASRREYNGLGQLMVITEHTTVAQGIQTTSSAQDRTTRFSYNARGDLLSRTDPMGFVERYTYDALGNKTSLTNQKQQTWTYQYDAAGRLIEERSPTVELTHSRISPSDQTLIVEPTTSDKVITRLGYDSFGRLISRTEGADRGEARTTRYEYDALGRQTRVIYPSVGVDNTSWNDLLNGGNGRLAPRQEIEQTLSTVTRYDAFGNAVSNRDITGSTSFKVYDRGGRHLYDVDALGGVTAYTRNAFGDLVRLVRYGARTHLNSLTTSELSQASVETALAGVSHHEDRTLTFEVDAMGRTVKTTEPDTLTYTMQEGQRRAGKVTRNTYNAFGELIQTAVQANASASEWNTTRHEYDKRGLRTATIDGLGHVSTWVYDDAGQLTEQVEYANALPPGAISQSGAMARPGSPGADPRDRITRYTYDQNQRKISEIRVNALQANPGFAIGPTNRDIITRYAYDAVGNLTQTIDANGESTISTYDALGRVTALQGPRVNTGSNGQAALQTLTRFWRDAHGNVITQTRYAQGASGATDAAGDPIAQSASDPENRTDRYAYDRQGRAIQHQDAGGIHHYTSYNTAGRVAKEWQGVWQDGRQQTLWKAFQYDSLGQLVRIIEPGRGYTALGNDARLEISVAGMVPQPGDQIATTQLEYNSFGELLQKSVQGEVVEWYRYDAAGHLSSSNAEDGQPRFYLYDLQGNQTAVLKSAGMGRGNLDLSGYTRAEQVVGLVDLQRIDRRYDLLGRLIEERLPERQSFDNISNPWQRPVIYRSFDRWGNVLSATDPRTSSWVTYFAYNANNQVTRQSHRLNGSGSDIVTETYYDALGRQIAIRDPRGNVNAQSYDGAGHLVEERHADGGIVRYRYNAFGNRISTTDEVGNQTDQRFDALDHLLSISSATAVQKVQFNNDITPVVSAQNTQVSYTYDAAGRRISETNGNQETIQYRYDLRGKLVSTQSAAGRFTRTIHDLQGRLVAQRDANGLDSSWRYDYFGQLLDHTDIAGTRFSYTYDNARQLFSETSSAGAHRQYAYDAAGQKIRVYDYSGYNAKTQTIDSSFQGITNLYDYDLAGNRILEQTLSWGEAVQGTSMAYDSLNRLMQVSNLVGYKVPIHPFLDAKTYMAFNPDILNGWYADARGLSQDEYALWHYGKYGVNETLRVTGLLEQKNTRVSNIQKFVNDNFFNRGRLADYLQLNRISIAEVDAATDRNMALWLSQGGIPPEAYTVAPTPPPLPPLFVVGPTPPRPEDARLGSVKALWQARYGSPKLVAVAMLEFRITVEELAYAVGTNPEAVHRYFATYQIAGQYYDLTQQVGYVDPSRINTLAAIARPRLQQRGNRQSAQELADIMLQYRISPAELAMAASDINSPWTLTSLQRYFQDAGLDRTTYDIGWRPLPRLLQTPSPGDTYQPTSPARDQLVRQIYTQHQGSLKQLAAAMLQNRIRPEELTAVSGEPADNLRARFTAAGIAAVNYDITQLNETSLTRGITYRYRAETLQSGQGQRVTQTHDYDLAGNRTHVRTTYQNVPLASTDRYYQYDAMNRQTVVDAQQNTDWYGTITSQQYNLADILGDNGHLVTYDLAGKRTSDTYMGAHATPHHSGVWQKVDRGLKVDIYQYDAWSRLSQVDTRAHNTLLVGTSTWGAVNTDLRFYDGANRVVRTGADKTPQNVAYFKALNGSEPNGTVKPGAGADTQYNQYDLDGRLVTQRLKVLDGIYRNIVNYRYDDMGHLLDYSVVKLSTTIDSTANAQLYSYNYGTTPFLYGYQPASIQVRWMREEEAAAWQPDRKLPLQDRTLWRYYDTVNTLTNTYDRNGFLVEVDDTRQAASHRKFINNAEGIAVRIAQGKRPGNLVQEQLNPTPTYFDHQLVANGQVHGRYGYSVNTANPGPADNPNYTPQASFSYGFEPVGPRYPAPTPSQWVVAAGDTLQSIAQSVYGNSKLWFLIAQANGLTDPSDLSSIQGQSLTLPARVTGSLNDAGSSKPYDPSTVRGASAPELPMPSAGSGGGCGGFGQVITAAVAIAVTFATQGAAISIWGGILGAGSTASALGYATAAAIGSVASQATGNILGVQQGFSWNAVALSALSAGITRGVVGDTASAASAAASSSWQSTAVQYAAANALTQSIGVVTGLQRSFDWRGVVASAAGSVTGQLSGHGLNQSNAFASWGDWGGQLARATTSGLAAGTTAAVMRGGRVSVQQVASDAFGNALGSSLAGLSSGARTQGQGPWSDADYRNGADVQSDAYQLDASRRVALYGLSSGTSARLGEPSGMGVSDWWHGVDRAIERGANELASTERRIADLAPPSYRDQPGVLLADSSGASPFTPGSSLDALRQGWSREDWSVLQGPKPLTYGLAQVARDMLGAITGYDAASRAQANIRQGNYLVGSLQALQSLGEAGTTVFGFAPAGTALGPRLSRLAESVALTDTTSRALSHWKANFVGPPRPLTQLDDVAEFLSENGKLPLNFIDKATAKSLGWNPKAGNLNQVAPNMSLGGDVYLNRSGALPSATGRIWYEADINYTGGYRGNERILYSNDGLIYSTTDHYKTFSRMQ